MKIAPVGGSELDSSLNLGGSIQEKARRVKKNGKPPAETADGSFHRPTV
jgi:hypothetical protein